MAVLFGGGSVIDVAPYRDLRGVGSVQVDWDGLVIPGLVDAHSHLRGISTQRQGVLDTALERWVVRLGALTALDVASDALVAAADLLRTGVTSVLAVHHAFAEPEEYVAGGHAMRTALRTIGLRGDVVLGVTDTHELTPAGAPATLSAPPVDAPELLRALAAMDLADRSGDVHWAIGPVGPQWCSDPTLEGIAELARDRGLRVHTHLMETVHQRTWAPPLSPVQRLARAGLLDERLSAAHGIWLSGAEQTLLAEAGVTVVHCPTSNLRLGSGSAPVPAWWGAGLPVALGLDSAGRGAHPDMFDEMRTAVRNAELHRCPGRHREVLVMATQGGARALDRSLGAVARGHAADLVMLEGAAAEATDVEALIESGSREHVRRVLVGGVIRLDDGIPVGCSEVEQVRAGLLRTVEADQDERQLRLRVLEAVEAEVEGALSMTTMHSGVR